jgi:hypothetical protein
MASLIPLPPPASAGLQDVAGGGGQELVAGVAGAADQTPTVDGATGGTRKRGKGKGADKRERRKSKRKGRKGTDTEEEEEEIRWDGSDAEHDDDPLADEEEDVDQLQSSTDERRKLPFSAKASLKYQHIVAVGRAGGAGLRKRGPPPRVVSSAVNDSDDDESGGAPLPPCPMPKPAYCRATGDAQLAAGTAMEVDDAPADKGPSAHKTPPANNDTTPDKTPTPRQQGRRPGQRAPC